MIEVVDPDTAWTDRFAELQGRYAAALGRARVPVLAIEHVGSTSVPGLAAKPIIDIDVVVDAEHVPAAIAAMESIGFVGRGDLGVPGRWAFHQPDDLPRTNTYVVEDGCLSLRNHLGVRGVLRADAALRDEYAAVKRALAAATDDIEEYIDGKTAVLAKVLRQAGLAESDLDEIAGVNRASGR